jgi:hypothetical protein
MVFKKVFGATVQAVAQAVSADEPIVIAPYAGTVEGVTYTPTSAITGADTNTRQVQLLNGATVVATLQFDSGIDGAANAEKAITLSGTAANLIVAAGDVLQWDSNAIGAGLADPGGRVEVEISPNYA